MSNDLDEELEEVACELATVDVEMQALAERRHSLVERKREIERILKQTQQQQNSESFAMDLARWSREDFSWSEKIRTTARNTFGIREFRELQLPCLNATLSKTDCILIIPTGGGKSLCYQLSAVVSPGWTLVISPLISLMEDQVMSMQRLNIDTRLLSASTEKEEQKQIFDDMTKPNSSLKLLYVTPERLAKSKTFMSRLEKAHQLHLLSRIAIDEVHCCSQWGHDFRPDYKFLGILRQQFPGVPLLCLTATASSDVVEDVKKVLNLPQSTLLFRASFNRPNLIYEVLEKPSQTMQCYDMMANLINRDFPGQSGIIYCLSKKDAEEVAVELQRRGIKTGIYHADINAAQRSEIHQKWISNKIQVVVATIAFGLGIDKQDVRFVLHHSISKSLENYYQESGRCGRDGKPARCVLLFRLADIFRISCMVFHERNTLPKLYAILRYAHSINVCRRRLMAEIFGEIAPDCGRKCDVCSSNRSVKSVDCSAAVSELLPELFPTGQTNSNRLTFLKALDKLSKLKSAKNLGLGSDLERVLAQMLLDGVIKEDFHFTPYNTISYLVPSNSGARQLEKGSISLKLMIVDRKPQNQPVVKKPRVEEESSTQEEMMPPPIRRRKTEVDLVMIDDDDEGDLIFE